MYDWCLDELLSLGTSHVTYYPPKCDDYACSMSYRPVPTHFPAPFGDLLWDSTEGYILGLHNTGPILGGNTKASILESRSGKGFRTLEAPFIFSVEKLKFIEKILELTKDSDELWNILEECGRLSNASMIFLSNWSFSRTPGDF